MFGSKGNFFKSTVEDYLYDRYGKNDRCDKNNLRVFQVNPPFIESLFIQSSKKIISFMQTAKQGVIPLMFIYFMPNWLDSAGYRSLKDSPFLVDESILAGNKHFYYESNYDK